MFQARRFRALRRAIIMATVPVTIAIASPGVAEAAVTLGTAYRVDAENLSLPSGGATFSDAGANGLKAVVLTANGTAWRWSLTPAGSKLVVRARGDQCKGAPRLAVAVDGTTRLNVGVTAKTWADYAATFPVTAGWHTIALTFDNDYASGSCNRNLRIDTITLLAPGEVNTGTAGSRCEPSDDGLVFTAPGSGTSTTWLGQAPAYYETGSPTGEYLGQQPKGVMILIHGGGWYVVGPAAVATFRPEADLWRARGWSTLSISYSGCATSLDDVLWFYDRTLTVTAGLPICASGASAGGHLALMLAARRPALSCVISRGAPTDLSALASQSAYDPPTGGQQTAGPTWSYHLAVAAFGSDRLAELSPVSQAASIGARALIATAARDVFIPLAQGDSLATALVAADPDAYVDVEVLEGGPIPWVHASVSDMALSLFHSAEISLVSPLVG